MNQSLFDTDTVDKNAWHLQGNWGPVEKELESSELVVKGEIPEGLNGLYVRNGMNPRSGYSDHWFFGNGMLHGFKFEDGTVSYNCLLYTSPSPRDQRGSRMPSSA